MHKWQNEQLISKMKNYIHILPIVISCFNSIKHYGKKVFVVILYCSSCINMFFHDQQKFKIFKLYAIVLGRLAQSLICLV